MLSWIFYVYSCVPCGFSFVVSGPKLHTVERSAILVDEVTLQILVLTTVYIHAIEEGCQKNASKKEGLSKQKLSFFN